MKESIQKKVESRELETSSYTPFTFNLKEFEFENNIKIAKDNRNQTEKANIQFLTKKIPYFKIKKKKLLQKIPILMMEDGPKMNIINLYKELFYMGIIGKKLSH